jgi:hypothetical protein
MHDKADVIATERIARAIYFIRGQNVRWEILRFRIGISKRPGRGVGGLRHSHLSFNTVLL